MRRLLQSMALIAACFAVYWPALRGAPVWDDNYHMTSDADADAAGLERIWTEPSTTRQFYPLTHTVFWIERQVFGASTTGPHVANVLLHALTALMLVAVLARLGVRHAWLAGWLFAMHPVMVESVAWISELKNTLSGAFFMGAALAYLAFECRRRRALYIAAAGLFACALMAKTTTAVLPAMLMVAVWWRRGRLEFVRDVAPLLPLTAVGMGAGFFTAWVERAYIGAVGTAWDMGVADRLLVAGRAPWWYLSSLAWPAGLAFSYPRWGLGAWWQWLYPLATAGAVLFCALLPRRTIGPPGALAVALCFLLGLSPALGLVNVYPFRYSFVADHFAYLAALPVAAGAAWLGARYVWRPARVALLATLAMLSWQHAADFAGPVALYRATLERNPGAWMASVNLAGLLPLEAAIPVMEAAARKNPRNSDVQNNLGALLSRSGRHDEALVHYQAAIAEGSDERVVALARANAGNLIDAIATKRLLDGEVARASLMWWTSNDVRPSELAAENVRQLEAILAGHCPSEAQP